MSLDEVEEPFNNYSSPAFLTQSMHIHIFPRSSSGIFENSSVGKSTVVHQQSFS